MSSSVSSKSIDNSQEESVISSLTYRLATLEDCDGIAQLVNSGYRGESSRQGWTTEEALIGGLRTDSSTLANILHKPNDVILIFFDKHNNVLIGCVHLQHEADEQCALLGMLTVRPDSQTRGYGKFILSTAENYVRVTWNVQFIKIWVIIQRTELVAFYNRRGFVDTGEREPFPTVDAVLAITKVEGLELCSMKKSVKLES